MKCRTCGKFKRLIPSIKRHIEKNPHARAGLRETSYECTNGCDINPLDRLSDVNVTSMVPWNGSLRAYTPHDEEEEEAA